MAVKTLKILTKMVYRICGKVGFGLNPADPSDATADGDNDGLNNLQFATMTSPISADTDMDIVNDGMHVR